MNKYFLLIIALWMSVCTANAESILEARASNKTKLVKNIRDLETLPLPPKDIISLVKYKTELGEMSAYLTVPPKKKKKSPAIIWITGGFPAGGIGDSAWKPRPKTNDQSAKIYRESGIVMMYPAFRGNAGNPGFQEGFYGEVNDVLSALEYLKKLDYVDNSNIYLGGHSTGGTLALLVAAATDEFKAIFAFGPVAAPIQYGERRAIHNPDDKKESELRSPVLFMDYIKNDTYIIEGSAGNIEALWLLKKYCNKPNVRFVEVNNADHFDVLYPTNKYIAKKISMSTRGKLVLKESEIQKNFDKEKF